MFGLRDRGAATLAAIGAGMLVTVLGMWLAGSRGVLGFPLMRARATNLEATRGTPNVWLVAHVDSKWQPVSMIMRVAGVVGSSAALVACVVAILGGFDHAAGWLLAAAWLFSIPLMLSVVGTRNHGTLDNASGVAAVLGAVEQIPRDVPLGVLITDAEELALAGASAWAASQPPGVAINVDSIDDDGPLVLMYTGLPPETIISRIAAAASSEHEELRVLRLIPGILTDHVALGARGWTTLTLSRGTLRTLERIHTSRDTLDHMDGRGIGGAARVLARTISELT
jgi:hypothetical protein